MKKLELSNFGVLEMGAREMKDFNGGKGLWDGMLIAGGLILQAFYDIGKYDGAHIK